MDSNFPWNRHSVSCLDKLLLFNGAGGVLKVRQLWFPLSICEFQAPCSPLSFHADRCPALLPQIAENHPRQTPTLANRGGWSQVSHLWSPELQRRSPQLLRRRDKWIADQSCLTNGLNPCPIYLQVVNEILVFYFFYGWYNMPLFTIPPLAHMARNIGIGIIIADIYGYVRSLRECTGRPAFGELTFHSF